MVCDGWNSDKSIEDKSGEAEVQHPTEVREQPQEELERPKSAQEKVTFCSQNLFRLDYLKVVNRVS